MDYLQIGSVRKSDVIAVFELFIGGIGIFFWGFGIIGVAIGEIEVDSAWLLLLIVPHIILFMRGMKRLKRSKRARKINTLLKNDTDGTKTVKDLARLLEVSESSLLLDLRWMFHKNYFKDCIFEQERTPRLYFKRSETARAVTPKVRMVSVKCPNCGAFNQLPAGRTGKCEYCDGPITTRARK